MTLYTVEMNTIPYGSIALVDGIGKLHIDLSFDI